MSESVFETEGEQLLPTAHARGPWDAQALHGGAPAALITAAFERMQPGAELRVARLGFEFLRPIPLAPLTLSTELVRPGRRVQELSAELRAGDQLICRATALRVHAIAAEVAAAAVRAPEPAALAPPEQGLPVRFALDGSSDASFAASTMEMRWLSDPKTLGPGQVWMRMRHPLLPDQQLSALSRLAATADFGNGVGSALSFKDFVFINADLTIHLQREPRGEWIGIDARTHLAEGGSGVAESVLHDREGPVARAFQTLVVQARQAPA